MRGHYWIEPSAANDVPPRNIRCPRLTNVASVTNIRIVTIFSLLILAPRAVFGDVHLGDVAFVSAVNTREVQMNDIPNDAGDCVALGELDIALHINNSGPPTIGIVLTDPRGRRIGFDPLTKRGWQESETARLCSHAYSSRLIPPLSCERLPAGVQPME